MLNRPCSFFFLKLSQKGDRVLSQPNIKASQTWGGVIYVYIFIF